MKRQDVTAAQIAEQLSLSRTTVSVVLNGRAKTHRIAESTTKRILAAARALNYRPNAAAQQLKGKRSNVVGVLVTSELMIDLRLIEPMELLAAERGVRFMLGHAAGSAVQIRDYLSDFRARGVDGLFSFFHHHPRHKQELLPELLRMENVVFYERPTDARGGTPSHVCHVGPDFFEVGRIGVRHLLDRGRRRIGLVLRELDFPYALARRRAYEAVLTEAGQRVDERLIWVMNQRTSRPWTDTFTPELALEAVDDLVIDKQADALVIVNDFYAASLICALRKRGVRVPEDVAIVSCDNQEFGRCIDPPLTTIDLRHDLLASALVGMMFELLDHQVIPKDRRAVVVPPELIRRESS